jgi:hypothetical protein
MTAKVTKTNIKTPTKKFYVVTDRSTINPPQQTEGRLRGRLFVYRSAFSEFSARHLAIAA